MLIVGINGSPKTDGNTALLLSRFLDRASMLGAQTVSFKADELLASLPAPYCTACSNPCRGNCYRGTALEAAFEQMANADGIVMASPVHFGTVSAQLKALFDHSRGLRGDHKLYNAVGAAISVGAARFGGQETTLRALHDIMLVHGMIIVGDGFRDADCGHFGIAAQKPALEDSQALARVEITVQRMLEVCEATQSIRKRSRATD